MTRCPAALWLRAHAVLLRQARDAAGRVTVPHTLLWTCARCGRDVGATILNQFEARRRDSGGEIPVRARFCGRENARPRLVARRQQAR